MFGRAAIRLGIGPHSSIVFGVSVSVVIVQVCMVVVAARNKCGTGTLMEMG